MARRHRRWARGTAWVAGAAALALLGVSGTAPGADIVAHLFGLLAGGALGVTALTVRRPLRRSLQWALVLAALAFIAGAARPGHFAPSRHLW